MSARTRLVLGAIAAVLTIAGGVVIQSQSFASPSLTFSTMHLPAVAPTTSPPRAPITIAPTTTTTAAPIVVQRPPVTTAPKPPALATSAAPAPAPVIHSSGTESCGWAWDATHFDDGFNDEVVITLEAPRRPNAVVTIQAVPHGSNAPMLKAVTTDSSGVASATFKLTADKRDWTITIGAQFASGSACAAQTFTISYS